MASKSMAVSSYIKTFDPINITGDVSDSDWEVIDPSDDDSFSYDGLTDDDLVLDDVIVPDDDSVDESVNNNDKAEEEEEGEHQSSFGSPSSDISMQSLLDQIDHQRQLFNEGVVKEGSDGEDHATGVNVRVIFAGGCRDQEHERVRNDYYYQQQEQEEEEEEEEEDEDLDLDDELVPNWVNNKFGRQRMRKLGKRAYPKMNKSKKLPYRSNRPGCVHGKHGLGLKHNLL